MNSAEVQAAQKSEEGRSGSAFYLLVVHGCLEPEVVGPYDSPEERDNDAQDVRAKQHETDALFWLDIRDGVPVAGAYSGGFITNAWPAR